MQELVGSCQLGRLIYYGGCWLVIESFLVVSFSFYEFMFGFVWIPAKDRGGALLFSCGRLGFENRFFIISKILNYLI